MPHDRNGELIEVGKIINIPCRVKSITLDENYCNLTVETLYPMPPYDSCNTYALNAKQVYIDKKDK